MKKRIEHVGEDVLDDIGRLSAEADWTDAEIDEALRVDGIDPEQLVNQVVSEVRAAFPHFAERPTAAPAILSLFDAGQRLGVDKFGLAARLRLSIGLVTKLNQRLIECSTVPAELVKELASIIGHSADEVLEYLRCKPRLAHGLSFKADEAPQTPSPQDFAEAVEKDRSLDAERKRELLQLARGE